MYFYNNEVTNFLDSCRRNDLVVIVWEMNVSEWMFYFLGLREVGYIFYGILFSCKIEWNITICDNLDAPGGHYAKSNKSGKSDREKQE